MGKLKEAVKAAGFIGVGVAGVIGVQEYGKVEREDLPNDLLAYFAGNQNPDVDLEVYQAQETKELCDNVQELIFKLGDAGKFHARAHGLLSADFRSQVHYYRPAHEDEPSSHKDNVCVIEAGYDRLEIVGNSLEYIGDTYSPDVIENILETLKQNLKTEYKVNIRQYLKDNPEASWTLDF